jgi:hypothetical protein
MYSDISPNLLLDISVNDEGLDELGPADGEWVVFLTGPDGHEAEFTVDRLDDGMSDPEVLAEAVANAVGDVLRGSHIFFEHYDVNTEGSIPAGSGGRVHSKIAPGEEAQTRERPVERARRDPRGEQHPALRRAPLVHPQHDVLRESRLTQRVVPTHFRHTFYGQRRPHSGTGVRGWPAFRGYKARICSQKARPSRSAPWPG